MSPHQSRGTTAGRVFNDLRNMARREGRSTDELLVFYVVERFLHRVSRSPYADQLVLKGGMLLVVLDARRSTRDADLLALELDRDEQRVAAWVREIASVDIDDGVVLRSTVCVRSRSARATSTQGCVSLCLRPSARLVSTWFWT